MNKPTESIQQDFLKKIKDLISQNLSLVDELSELLQLSTDSAYRRIRGETALSMDEIIKICKHYRISFDAFSGLDSGNVIFNYKYLTGKEDFKNYLLSLLDLAKKLKHNPHGQLIYGADDTPISYHFAYPEQSAFKMFYWMQSVLNEPSLIGKKFSLSLIDEELLDIGKQIEKTYLQFPTIEIWTDESLNSTLKQLEYCWESGLLEDNRVALVICEQLFEMLDKIQKQAEMESKTLDLTKNFQMYHSEIQVGNNCILVYFGDVQMSMVRHQTLNTMTTTNPSFCAQTEVFLKNLMKKSILISGTAERQRYQFFHKIRQNVEKLVLKVKS